MAEAWVPNSHHTFLSRDAVESILEVHFDGCAIGSASYLLRVCDLWPLLPSRTPIPSWRGFSLGPAAHRFAARGDANQCLGSSTGIVQTSQLVIVLLAVLEAAAVPVRLVITPVTVGI
jgi:hypothetical protein